VIKEINYLSACYSPGSDLWIVPSTPNSNWYKKLNWYCSSQLSIWTFKTKPDFADPLKEIIKNESLPFLPEYQSNQDILIDTSNIFQNRALLAIDISKGLENWLSELSKKSNQLNIDSVRIFWGQSQIQDFLKSLVTYKHLLSDIHLEIVTCEPDRL
jgi:hypothetical protein